jgi:hypothetical protein
MQLHNSGPLEGEKPREPHCLAWPDVLPRVPVGKQLIHEHDTAATGFPHLIISECHDVPRVEIVHPVPNLVPDYELVNLFVFDL